MPRGLFFLDRHAGFKALRKRFTANPPLYARALSTRPILLVARLDFAAIRVGFKYFRSILLVVRLDFAAIHVGFKSG